MLWSTLLHVDTAGQSVLMNEHGWAAIGCAVPLSSSQLEDFKPASMTTAEALVYTYRLIENAIRSSSSGVGPPIRLARIYRDGSIVRHKLLGHEELSLVRHQVASWRKQDGVQREATLKKFAFVEPDATFASVESL